MASESVAKINGGLLTGFGGRSSLKTWLGTNDFGTLEVSREHLSIASWFLRSRYELQKELIERLILKQYRLPKGPGFGWLRILHNEPGAPYVVFVTCAPTELQTALTNAGYSSELVTARGPRQHNRYSD